MSNIKTLKPGESGYGYLIERDSGYIDPKDSRNETVIKEAFDKIGKNTDTSAYGTTEFPLILTALLQKSDIKNQNGRIYPDSILRKEVENYKVLISKNISGGEVEHPQDSNVNLNKLSHRVLDIWWENNTVLGKILIYVSLGFVKYGVVSTSGDLIALYLSYGHRCGVSSRALGSVHKDKAGNDIVGTDLSLICFDLVSSPSTPNCWITPNPSEASLYIESKEDSKKETLFEQQIKKMNLLL